MEGLFIVTLKCYNWHFHDDQLSLPHFHIIIGYPLL